MSTLSKKENFSKYNYFILFAAAFLIRTAAAAISGGFSSDTACFAAWADRIYRLGPGSFYSPDVFTDYPPGYMYLLYPIGALCARAGFVWLGSAHLILLRMPAILCDLISGGLLCLEGKKRFSPAQVLFLCAAYLLNPAVILNSAVWGQVDSVFTLALLIMCLSLMEGRMLPAYISFGAGLLVKPQTLFLGPVILAAFLEYIILKDFSLKKLLVNLGQIIGTCLGMLLLCLPFGLSNVGKQYFSTVGSYPYASVNAYNIWALLGKSWVSQEALFLGLPCRFWGGLMVAAAILMTFLFCFRLKRDAAKYPLLSAFLLISIFVFSVRMHERYLYPAMLFLLLAFLCKPVKQLFYCYCGFSLLHFCNTAHVLFCYDPQNYDRTAPIILLTSAGMMLMTICLYRTFYLLYPFSGGDALENDPANRFFDAPSRRSVRTPKLFHRPTPLHRADWIWILLITAVYSCFALYDLGDCKAPVTTWDMTGNQTIELDFDGQIPASLHYYIAPWNGRNFLLEEKQPGDSQWNYNGQITLNNVFTWQEVALNLDSSQLRLTLLDSQASLIELTFLDADGDVMMPSNAEDYPALFDESDLKPERSSFRNSMYFDEIYHARTAYEFLHGLPAYENTHPPLGKIFIALGIAVFGMNPFGWRIIGTLFGIAMVPVCYLFARRLTGSTAVSALACVLFTFDFMHFTQTRLATIDVYITFFVILMYFFMYQYCTETIYGKSLKKALLPLGACGICMGLGIACKWTGVYAGLGLAILFFVNLYRRYREGKYTIKTVLQTILFCLLFFVAVPVLIYLLSYLPFRDYTEDGLILRVLHNQETMFRYHSGLESTHPYSSSWYEWPIIKRPIWYFSAIVTGSSGNGGIREGISAFGNPLVWWNGIPASLYMVYLWAKKKDRTAAFLTVGYLAQYLPWFFVTRITFIYHYFPSIIFLVLMIAHSIMQWKKKLTKRSFILLCSLLGGLATVLFFLFYPVLSGQPVDAAYVDKWLRWFDSWVLTAK